MNKEGLTLTGTIVASKIDSGNRKDDGKPWARSTATVTDGTNIYQFSQSIDPSIKSEPYPTGKKCSVQVNYANTQSGIVSVGGEITIEK